MIEDTMKAGRFILSGVCYTCIVHTDNNNLCNKLTNVRHALENGTKH